ASVARILELQKGAQARRGGRPIEIVSVCARDRTRDRGVDLSGCAWFDDPVEMAKSDRIDCVVELIGGSDGPAHRTVEAALSHGKHVVTANKALLAKHGGTLSRMAEERGLGLAF